MKKFSEQRKKAEDILKSLNALDRAHLQEKDRASLERIQLDVIEIING